jgi:hypothetical protein
MKLSKPEEMDDLDEPAINQSGDENVADGGISSDDGSQQKPSTVDLETLGEMSVPEAVGLHNEMLNNPESFGMASAKDVRELRRVIEEQRAAIAELVEAVEGLAQLQGEEVLGMSRPSLMLNRSKLSAVDEPVPEFGKGGNPTQE